MPLNLFGASTPSLPEPVVRLLPKLYRITDNEFLDFIKSEFDLVILAADHRFKRPPDKIGAEDTLQLYGTFEAKNRERQTVVLDAVPFRVTRTKNSCIFEYTSDYQTFRFWFSGNPIAIAAFGAFLASDAQIYCLVFLYVLNRHRASRKLERDAARERAFVARLYDTLRKSNDLSESLRYVCETVGFDAAACLVYAPYTEELVPIVSTDDSRDLARVPVSSLTRWDALVRGESGIEEADLATHDSHSCNCNQFHMAGYNRALFVRVGHEESHAEHAHASDYPRAVLCLYRKDKSEITDREALLLQYTARELAAWIDDIDERIEHSVLSAAISITERYCSLGLMTHIRREIFSPILQDLSREMTLAFSAAPLTGRRHEFAIGFLADGNPYGLLDSTIHDEITELMNSDSDNILIIFSADPERSAIVDYRTKPTSSGLAVMSHPDDLTFMRPHLYRWLGSLVTLVYHLVLLEERRVTWVHKAIHEIRHPLQGLITFGWDFRWRLESNASRTSLVHHLEDMETSIERMNRMLAVLDLNPA